MAFNWFQKRKERKNLESKKQLYISDFYRSLHQITLGHAYSISSLQNNALHHLSKNNLEALCLQMGLAFDGVKTQCEYQALVRLIEELLQEESGFDNTTKNNIKTALMLCSYQMSDMPITLQEKYKFNNSCLQLRSAPLDKLRFKGNLDISLAKTETCYFSGINFNWLEERKVTTSTSYASASRRQKFLGTTYRTGNIRTYRHTKDVWKTIASGNLYITNKRIILKGRESKNIRLNKVLDLNVYTNGLMIYRDTGKAVFLENSGNRDECHKLGLLLNRLLEASS